MVMGIPSDTVQYICILIVLVVCFLFLNFLFFIHHHLDLDIRSMCCCEFTEAKTFPTKRHVSEVIVTDTVLDDVIHKHLRASERIRMKKMELETSQKDIRAVLVNWLVKVSEELRLSPETLYLTVNYLDRYLSGDAIMEEQRMKLLGVSCMLIASKYEEINPPEVKQLCNKTENKYSRHMVLDMEKAVLISLNFEMSAITIMSFLGRFIRVRDDDKGFAELEFLASYICELSLLDCAMVFYAPSVIAGSAVFLARFIVEPEKMPWNSGLRVYTQYEVSDLRDCVLALHKLCCCNSLSSGLGAVREKYSQLKYRFVAKKQCPAAIPPEFFQTTAV